MAGHLIFGPVQNRWLVRPVASGNGNGNGNGNQGIKSRWFN